MYKAKIYISLKKTVADPQGLTVKHGLENLRFSGIEEVRMGKFIEIKLKEKDEAHLPAGEAGAQAKVKAMCEKLLVNPIIEDFSFTIEKA